MAKLQQLLRLELENGVIKKKFEDHSSYMYACEEEDWLKIDTTLVDQDKEKNQCLVHNAFFPEHMEKSISLYKMSYLY